MRGQNQTTHWHRPELDIESKQSDSEERFARADINLEHSHPQQTSHPSMAQLVRQNCQCQKNLEDEEIDEYPPHSEFRLGEPK